MFSGVMFHCPRISKATGTEMRQKLENLNRRAGRSRLDRCMCSSFPVTLCSKKQITKMQTALDASLRDSFRRLHFIAFPSYCIGFDSDP